MTGTASSKGKIFMDFDSYKNQEWLRRRRLRLEQVRKQSNEIARILRKKASDEEKKQLEGYKKVREEKLRVWKAEKLEELEKKIKFALEGFGIGYKLAEEEPEAEFIMEEKNKMNWLMAQKRGEIAHQEELKKNKLNKENVTSAIVRKKITRKREDLRSALVRSVPIKKQVVYQKTDQSEKQKITLIKKIKRHSDKSSGGAFQKKASVKNLREKNQINYKFCKCKNPILELSESKTCPVEGGESLWINLDKVQISSAGESEPNLRSTKSTVGSKKSQREKGEGSVEFYDFSSRYYCKSFKEYPHLVERIKFDSKKLNANELAKMEEVEREEAKKKLNFDAVSQERGMEALRKDKVIRDYNNLMTKLEDLNKKEKILKSSQRNPPSFLHMNDERLSERTKTRQRIMESKFERVYYEAIAKVPPAALPHPEPVYNLFGAGDYPEAEQGRTTKLSFSPSNLKHNSPVASSGKSSSEVSLPETIQSSETADNETSQRQLLININNTLREGRELRKTISRNRKSNGSEGREEQEMSSDSESEVVEARSKEELPGVSERTLTKCQESQTENLKSSEEEKDLRLKNFGTGEDSLPISTSTSYKSPPGVIRSLRLQQFLDYLEGLNDSEEHCRMQSIPKLKTKVNTMLHDLLNEEGSSKPDENDRTSPIGPTLRYYIQKLLNMSRECIANLSVSSENISTPSVTDFDTRNESEASGCSYISSFKEEDLVRNFKLKRADMLENSMKNWKMIFENNSQPKPQNMPNFLDSKRVQGEEEKTKVLIYDICSPQMKSRYDEITKKCSERILELSDMLDKVRKDKEKLLSSASGGSSIILSKSERNMEKELDAEEEAEEEVVHVRKRTPKMRKTSPVLEGFINRYNLTRPREETVSTIAVADSQSLHDLNESLESWPDVMDELLKKEILTSPFKWSDGELSSEFTTINDNCTKPSSIESLIGNFRKEIDKIKPFALEESCSQSNSPIKPRWSTDGEYREIQTISCLESGAECNRAFKEESSVESINHYLTSLGLNWAKSLLRKNAESRAKNSSSNSGKKSSEDEDGNFL